MCVVAVLVRRLPEALELLLRTGQSRKCGTSRRDDADRSDANYTCHLLFLLLAVRSSSAAVDIFGSFGVRVFVLWCGFVDSASA